MLNNIREIQSDLASKKYDSFGKCMTKQLIKRWLKTSFVFVEDDAKEIISS